MITSMHPTRARVHGMTLIEVLVVIAIIGLLIGLLLPAVQQARESARLASCKNNLRQIGLALLEYEAQLGVLPPSTISSIENGVWSSNPAEHWLHSWASLILPHLEQRNLQAQIDYRFSALSPQNYGAASIPVPTYRCPSYIGHMFSEEPRYASLSPTFAIRNYVAMGATTVGKLWKRPNGVFYSGSATRILDVKDGSSHTFFIAETREEDAAVWIDGSTATVTSRPYDPINAPDYARVECGLNHEPFFVSGGQGIDCRWGPSSFHPGGANHLFGDGSVRFVVNFITPAIYDALTTRAGGEVPDSAGP